MMEACVWYKIKDSEYLKTGCGVDTLIKPDELVKYCFHCGKDIEEYHDKKEIRPENAGELWEYESTIFMICKHSDGGFSAACSKKHHYKDMYSDTFQEIIHNQNGWTRLYPVVDDVERIEIEGVRWISVDVDGVADGMLAIDRMAGPYHDLRDFNLPKQPPMKMILEIPKEGE